MKMQTKLWLVLSATICLRCGGGPASPAGRHSGSLQVRLSEAAAAWARHKPDCATYHYLRATTSFTGSTSETAIEISSDRPSRRRYVAHQVQDNGEVKTERWDETGAAIGSHEGAFPAKTVEELFADCREALRQDPAANDLTLRIGDHGVPTACTFVPRDCADDCLMGVALSGFACSRL